MSANNCAPLISSAVACGGVMATYPGARGLVLMSERDLERFREGLAAQQSASEWDLRGTLARLKCWHRLTEEEAADLVDLFSAQQAAPQPLIRATGEKVSENAQRFCTARVDHPSTFTLGWRAAEVFHGIKEQA